MTELKNLFDAILGGNLQLAIDTTNEALSDKVEPQVLINDYMVKAMEEIGARFEAGTAYVPNLLMSARAMKGSLDILKPLLSAGNSATAGKIIIGTVKGDLHDIGKNLVASMFEGCGFEVINLGVDVPSEKFVEAIKEHKANILCMSALLTTTMVYMKDVIDALETAGIRNDVKVMVGGAPLSHDFAMQIGADGYSDNANAAVILARTLVA